MSNKEIDKKSDSVSAEASVQNRVEIPRVQTVEMLTNSYEGKIKKELSETKK